MTLPFVLFFLNGMPCCTTYSGGTECTQLMSGCVSECALSAQAYASTHRLASVKVTRLNVNVNVNVTRLKPVSVFIIYSSEKHYSNPGDQHEEGEEREFDRKVMANMKVKR